ncbi:hypothetical protein H6503_03970 [Candidatus Woesearchaeota archaeon]|nr:hypothetical protein [Candidatus Woesearchaeota archaeon]
MRLLWLIAMILTVFLVACAPSEEVTVDDDSAAMDVDDDGDADVQIEQIDDGAAEVTVEMDDVIDDEAKEKIKDIDADEYCVPGSTYTYDGEDGSVDSEVIGLTAYKGKQMCEAESETVIDSPAGKITTMTTYYFDNTYKEYWIVTSTTGAMMPSPQVNEIHLVDGEVVN